MKRPSQIGPLSILLCFFIGTSSSLYAQCTTGNEPECKCATAPVLCTIDELDGYTFQMAAFQHPNDGPSPICPGANMTQTNNPTWFAFTAWCTDLRLRVTSTNCHQAQGYIGFQLAIYSDCTFNHLVACNADVNDCNTNDKILNLTGLNIGAVYYFMVDGCLGSYCTVTIDIIGTCGSEHIEPWSLPISGNTDPCVGDTETYTVEDLDGARIYFWYIDGVLKGQTTSENFNVQWTTPGTYQLCVDASNDPCVDVTDPPGPLCKDITVHKADAGKLIVTPTVCCSGDNVQVVLVNYTGLPYNSEMMLITDSNGIIIYAAYSGVTIFGSFDEGEYTVYAYNFLTSGGFIPTIGQSISTINCNSSCCDLKSQSLSVHSINATINDYACDDNGTGNDSTDDVFTFLVTVDGFPAGNVWKSNTGLEGNYLTPTLFGPYPISGGPINFTIQDEILPGCTIDMVADKVPPSCSSCPETMDAGIGSVLTCKDTVATLSGTSTATGVYHWSGPDSFSSDSLICMVQDSGWYQLLIDFGKQCISVDCVYVAQNLEAPIANAGADQQLDCLHEQVTLDASGSGGNNFILQWSNANGLLLSTQSLIVIDTAGLFVLQLTNTETGCSSQDTALVTINQNELGEISFLIMDENCIGEENGVIEVMNITGGMPPYNFTLNTNSNSTGIFDQLSPGDYQLHIADAAGCSLDTMITIHEGIALEVELPETIIFTENEGGSIEAQVNVPQSSLNSIQWSPPGVLSCDTCLATNIFTNVPQTLTITVTYVNGCVASAQIDILVVPAPNIFIPNTFSPNDDGINDQFTVFTNDGVLSIREMNIYDRWGEHIFNAKEISPNEPIHGWDGKFHEKNMPAGVYAYVIKVLVADGRERSLQGDVTLVR